MGGACCLLSCHYTPTASICKVTRLLTPWLAHCAWYLGTSLPCSWSIGSWPRSDSSTSTLKCFATVTSSYSTVSRRVSSFLSKIRKTLCITMWQLPVLMPVKSFPACKIWRVIRTRSRSSRRWWNRSMKNDFQGSISKFLHHCRWTQARLFRSFRTQTIMSRWMRSYGGLSIAMSNSKNVFSKFESHQKSRNQRRMWTWSRSMKRL